MALQLKKQNAKIAHLNVREEKHGEDSVLAVDVKLKMDLANEFLDTLEAGLRKTLYRPDDDQLEGIEAPMSILRFPQLAPLHWNAGQPNVVFTVHGAKKADDMVFDGSIGKPLNLDSKQGGTVEVLMQVQVHPEPEQLAELGTMLGKTAKISVKPGEAQEPVEPAAGDGQQQEPGEGAGQEAAGQEQRPDDWPFPPAVH